MTNPELINRIIRLIKEKPTYAKILKAAVVIEENPPDDFIREYGWEWHHVKAMPAQLTKLVAEGIIEIKYKSRRYTHYKLRDREATKEALRKLGLL